MSGEEVDAVDVIPAYDPRTGTAHVFVFLNDWCENGGSVQSVPLSLDDACRLAGEITRAVLRAAEMQRGESDEVMYL